MKSDFVGKAWGWRDDGVYGSPILGNVPNDIRLIVDMKSNITWVARLDFWLYWVRCSFRSISPTSIDLSPMQQGHHWSVDMWASIWLRSITHLNGILANFNHCDLQTKYRIFVSYCTSYYGSCLWDLQHRLVGVFYTTWRKAIRRLFGLPRNAHCNMLPLVAACLPIQSQLLNRCANFVNSCLNSNTSIEAAI